jgi:putative DNA primase/helicase
MNEESFDVWELFGKMVNICGDLSKTDLKETGMFKMLVGRDTISARRKFLNVIKFVNHAKLTFACNELPRVYDTTDGFWTKWVVLDFPYKFVSQEEYDKSNDVERINLRVMNPDIIEHISTPSELSGLLNAALDGLSRLLKNKDFSVTAGTKEIKEMWVRKSDSFMSFCMDCLQEDFEYFMPKGVLRKVYSLYCKKYKIKGVSDKSIKATLEEEFGVSESKRSLKDEQVHCWDGIKFNIQGIHDIHGISPLYKILNFTIGSNMVDKVATLDIYEGINKLLKIKSYD